MNGVVTIKQLQFEYRLTASYSAEISNHSFTVMFVPKDSNRQKITSLAPSLVAMAYSEDGLVEAVHKRDQSFMWAVQWHPEFMWMTDVNSRKIFKAFISISAIG